MELQQLFDAEAVLGSSAKSDLKFAHGEESVFKTKEGETGTWTIRGKTRLQIDYIQEVGRQERLED